jgi:voltage-gated sodium channel
MPVMALCLTALCLIAGQILSLCLIYLSDLIGHGLHNTVPSLKMLSLIKAVRLMRVVRVFKVLRDLHELNKIIGGLQACFRPVLNAFALLFILTTIYAVVGTHLYRDMSPQYYGK